MAKRVHTDGTATYERQHGQGSVYEDKFNGTWVAAVTTRLPDGRRKRKTARARTKNEANAKLRELLKDQADGIESSATYTVGKAVDAWLARGLNGKAPKTGELYRGVLAKVTELIGTKPLADLKPDDVYDMLVKIGEDTSSRNVEITHQRLTNVIDHAMRNRRVNWNAARLAERPRGRGKGRPSKSFTFKQTGKLLETAKGTRLEAYVTLSLLAGIRTEEARALRWDHVVVWADDATGWQPVTDVGFDGHSGRYAVYVWRSVRVGGDTKTEKSRRTLTLSKRAVEALRGQQERQAADRVKAGPLWRDHGLVFASRVGTALIANNVIRDFRKLTVKAGLGDNWTPREMRHTYVSIMSANGVPVEEIAQLVGHQRTATTELVYRHELRPALTRGSEVMDSIFA